MVTAYGSIAKRIHIDAPPHAVYEVIGSPEHIAAWWFDEAGHGTVGHASGRPPGIRRQSCC